MGLGSPCCCDATGFHSPRSGGAQESSIYLVDVAKLLENPFSIPPLRNCRSCAAVLCPRFRAGSASGEAAVEKGIAAVVWALQGGGMGTSAAPRGHNSGFPCPLASLIIPALCPPRCVITTDVTFVQVHLTVCDFQKRISGRSSPLQLLRIWCGQLFLPNKLNLMR